MLELAHENINEDLRYLQGAYGQNEEGEIQKMKDSILKKLKRLSPGEMNGINNVVDDLGEHHAEPKDMAKVMANHWSDTFGPSQCDEALLKEWLSIVFPQLGPDMWDTGMLHRSQRTGRSKKNTSSCKRQ